MHAIPAGMLVLKRRWFVLYQKAYKGAFPTHRAADERGGQAVGGEQLVQRELDG